MVDQSSLAFESSGYSGLIDMTRLNWDQAPRVYEEGVDHAVLYSGDEVVVWNGLVAVDEHGTGEQDLNHYLDGRRLVVSQQIGDFEASLQAYTYPDEFDAYNGYLDDRTYRRFGLSYRTQSSDGDKLHIIYNALVRPNNRSWSSLTNVSNPSIFIWDIQASSVNVPGARPTSHLIVDTATAKPELIQLIEEWLYGTDLDDPRLPDPEEIVDVFEAATTLRITQNEDGTWTATGPDDIVVIDPDGSFQITAPTAHFLDVDLFVVDSF